MTDYRRLTEKNINDVEFCNGCSYNDDFNGCEDGGCDKYFLYFNVYERLRKLEDMIENGRLVDANDVESENAAMRKQISEMVMPPCTLGDTLYLVSFCFGDGYDEAGNATHTCGWQITETKVDEKNFYKMCDLVRNQIAFFSREAAEARLAELKGGKE